VATGGGGGDVNTIGSKGTRYHLLSIEGGALFEI